MHYSNAFSSKIRIESTLEISLKDESNYFIQKITLQPKDSLHVKRIGLIDLPKNSGLKTTGVVVGSPLAGNNFFCAIEHPMSLIDTVGNAIVSYIRLYEPINKVFPPY